MTIEELCESLQKMTADDWVIFRQAIGEDSQDPKYYVGQMMRRPDVMDQIFSLYFEVPTEQQRRDQAIRDGADAAKRSAEAAAESARQAQEANDLAKKALRDSIVATRLAWIGIVITAIGTIAQIR